MKIRIRILSVVLCLCFAAAGLISCGEEAAVPMSAAVLTVNGQSVSYELYRYFFQNYREEAEAAKKKETGAETESEQQTLDSVHKSAISSVEAVYATLSLASEYGIHPEDAEIETFVNATIASVKEQYIDKDKDPEGEKGYAKELETYYMTENVLRFLTAVDECESAAMTKMLDGGEIPSSDEEIRALIAGDAFVCVKHVLISDDNGRSPEENRTLAEDVRNQALSGTDFDTLVANYSNDYAMTRDGYYLPRGYTSKEYENVAFSLSVGELSEPVRLSDGYYVILCCEKDPSYIEKNFSTLKETYQECRFYEKLDQKKAATRAEKTELFATIDWSAAK